MPAKPKTIAAAERQQRTGESRENACVVVTDVRFENEVDLLARALDAVVWHVRRPGRQPVAAHESEAGVAFRPGDIRIENDGSLDDLRAAVLRELGRWPN